jgi:exosortase
MKRGDLVKLGLISFLVMLAYVPTFKWMIDRWTEGETYYSHGFLILPISVFLVWLKRKQLVKLKLKPHTLGWLFFGAGILMHAVSMSLKIYFSSGFSLVFVIVGLVLLFFGKEWLKELCFSIGFLFFMLPLPLFAIANIAFRLKIFAAQVSVAIVRAMGVPVVRQGSVIRTMHAQLMVEDPCSGIRSLIALIALGALMAYFSNTSKIKKGVLFISSIPIAVGANIIRIVALTLVSEMYGSQFALGWFHETMGILVFVFAFVGLSLVGKLLE